MMGWGRIDDGFDDHPKVLALLDDENGTDAIALWTLCFSYVHRTRRKGKTPGVVPSGLPRQKIGAKGTAAAQLLVDVGLWDEGPSGGWVYHDFGDYLPRAETSQVRSEAGRRGAEARWAAERKGSSDGSVPSDDGSVPSDDGKPHGKPMANDGSRATCARVPTPTPNPNPEGQNQEQLQKKPSLRSGQEKATRLPEPFPLTDDMKDWARSNTPNVGNGDHEAFLDYFRGAPGAKGVKLDWTATWRNWMRRANNDRPRQKSVNGELREYNGMMLSERNIQSLKDQERYRLMDAAAERPAIEASK